ncbi:hypothetical protein ACFXOD_18140 [Streptomyces sp. NPDC059161]|uniref:hypothetical protein n=1 Tax=Streptomyces sp. NPDC059161 TaxID=3346749 RepID=UPI0036891B79
MNGRSTSHALKWMPVRSRGKYVLPLLNGSRPSMEQGTFPFTAVITTVCRPWSSFFCVRVTRLRGLPSPLSRLVVSIRGPGVPQPPFGMYS